MAFPQGTCTDSREPFNAPNAPLNVSSVAAYHCCDYKQLKFKQIFRRMIGELGLAYVRPSRRLRSSGKLQVQGKADGNKHKKTNLEHNKAWLLAESGACGAELTATDPQSVHSSFVVPKIVQFVQTREVALSCMKEFYSSLRR